MKLLIILLMLFSALILYGCNPEGGAGGGAGNSATGVTQDPSDNNPVPTQEIGVEDNDDVEINEVVEEFAEVVEGSQCGEANCIEQEDCNGVKRWNPERLKCTWKTNAIMLII